MKSDVGFLSLAEELQLYILRFLPYRDILRCTSVCKALRQAYVSSSELQYIVELGGQHLIPISNTDSDNHTPVSEHLQHLRDRAHAWFRVDIHSAKTVPIPELFLYEESFIANGHLYSWDSDDDTATIIPILPKPSQQIIERNWSPGTLCTVPNSTNLCVLMDPAQNLIAVVYFDDEETLYVNLRALDDDSFHPKAAGPTLFLSELPGYDNDVDSESVKLKVMGRHIALQRAASDCDMWQVQIWDWQHSTSDIILSGDYPHEVDFCFLGNDRLLVVADNLKLFSIEDMSKTPELLASFVPPVQLLETRLLPSDGISCGSQPQMQAQPTMYTSDPKHQLLCITTFVNASFVVYVISTRIFFDLVEMAVAMPIPWKCWGPLNTRIFRCPLELDECRVHLNGSRVLLLFRVRKSLSKRKPIWNCKYKLCIMDFSPLAVTNRRGLGQVVTKPSTLNVTDPKYKRNGCEERLMTFLPYVKVVLDRKFSLDDLENIWLDKDRIYLLSDKLEVIDV
ncbi:hypothetical protein DFJ58DRAFT_747910 [Suillus subalutaceus]|uniref:uncharacterized protein n=1 Tax=Suillus subalutaceus TaxID=48586 RepID=UPI001B85CBE6|nr:uncharacterized protein DFJ58DRAFT_747910 [Suillus subalutaceus]KAG1843365.1 hypothetical protein DFJ58DRAFT_747910 [Suillus subalutaceus]